MEKELFEKDFIKKLNKNFPELSENFEFDLKVFNGLNTLIFEINKCLILELHKAAITLTNYLLERLLKLALINNEVGIGEIPLEKWNSVFEEPNRKYGSINLSISIELCKDFNLISEEEKIILDDIIRKLIRNGFSHADSSKILINLPDEGEMYLGSLRNPTEFKEIKLNQKIIPIFQELQMENFAKATSKIYFKFVFDLIFEIEKRLIERKQ